MRDVSIEDASFFLIYYLLYHKFLILSSFYLVKRDLFDKIKKFYYNIYILKKKLLVKHRKAVLHRGIRIFDLKKYLEVEWASKTQFQFSPN